MRSVRGSSPEHHFLFSCPVLPKCHISVVKAGSHSKDDGHLQRKKPIRHHIKKQSTTPQHHPRSPFQKREVCTSSAAVPSPSYRRTHRSSSSNRHRKLPQAIRPPQIPHEQFEFSRPNTPLRAQTSDQKTSTRSSHSPRRPP